MNLPTNRSKGEISFIVWIRAISVFLILLCHLTQAHSNGYVVMTSQIFNVGVNIFIIVSGFLFGRFGVNPPYGKWLVKRVKRIFVPYWLFLVVALTLLVAAGTHLSATHIVMNILGLHGFAYGLPGSAHTWFITAILLCYLFTPLMAIITDYVISKDGHLHRNILIVVLCFPVAIGAGLYSAIVMTVPFYFLAFLMGKLWDESKIKPIHAMIALCIGAAVFILRFLARFVLDNTVWYTNLIAPYTHYLAAFSFFIAGARLFDRVPCRFVRFINDISFEIYLFHYSYMHPASPVMTLTGNWFLNSAIAILLTLPTAWAANRLVASLSCFLSKFHHSN